MSGPERVIFGFHTVLARLRAGARLMRVSSTRLDGMAGGGRHQGVVARVGAHSQMANALAALDDERRTPVSASPPIQAHSKSEFKRLDAQGANVVPPESARPTLTTDFTTTPLSTSGAWQEVESAPFGEMALLWHRAWRHAYPGQVINNETGECVLDSPTPEHKVVPHFASHWTPLTKPLSASGTWNGKERRHTIDTAIGVNDRRSSDTTNHHKEK